MPRGLKHSCLNRAKTETARGYLKGWRGREKADIPAIARIVHQVSVLAATLGPRLAELDINPLRVQGSRAVAADARARWVA